MGLGLQIARNEDLPVPVRRLAMMASGYARTPERFERRVKVLRYATPPRLTDGSLGPLGPIWMFWAQGLDSAPAIVRASIDSIQSYAGGREVRILSFESVSDHVEMPNVFMAKRGEMDWAKFANGLRLALLARHGGTWFDATILQVAPMPTAVLEHDLVLPMGPRITRLVGNWFLHARAGHPLIQAWLDALVAYRELDLRHRPYMHMHYLMEAIVIYNARCEAMLQSASGLIAANPCLAIVRTAKKQADATPWDDLVAKSWMHKLSYKQPGAAPIERWLARRGEGVVHQ